MFAFPRFKGFATGIKENELIERLISDCCTYGNSKKRLCHPGDIEKMAHDYFFVNGKLTLQTKVYNAT
ncbi:hypothetical protein PSCICM_02380 [Pseudomonas cichorii]|nr:hypothetical protein PSCICM_02380 [Pseudomonas cichorii]